MRLLFPIVLFSALLWSCNQKEKTLFRQVSSQESGLTFRNEIVENEMLNMINYQYLYNGGGVGIGDFNNDSLPDIYFTASLSPSKLFLNRGNLKFEDVTDKAGVAGEKKWCRGATVVDINNDGLQDLYVCAAAWQNPELKKDILYVNQGVDPSTGIPAFREMAKEYGLVDTVSTHMAAFFDYDNDGDLDLYLVVNDLNNVEYPNTFRPVKNDGSAFTNDILYRCDWNDQLQHPVYTDVSKAAGITWEGNGLGISILDINQDGWKDIYVSNDYLSGNLLYVNNRNGTFTNKSQEYFKKGSLNAMGNDAGDINNDGLVDLVEMDMMPEDNYRQKMMMNPVDYNWYLLSEKFQIPYQTVRNTLQLNRGRRVLSNDSLGEPFFSEIAFYGGVAYTDWSWAALLSDLDNDGYKDLMTTNGLPKDVTDLDFIAYRDQSLAVTLNDALQKLPAVHISNYVYRNNGDLSFTDKTDDWGWNFPTYSAGIAYSDLDRDGDLDIVINNTNMEASLLENQERKIHPERHYLQVRFRGDTSNINGIGTSVRIHYNNQLQTAELSPYRGYMSSVENKLHFGLDTSHKIDSVCIRWPNGKTETLTDVAADQELLISQSANALHPKSPNASLTADKSIFRNITNETGLNFMHQETDFVDFNQQRQLPFKYSQGGPSIVSGDLNNDQLDDLVIGGTAPYPAVVFFQQTNGKFIPRVLYDKTDQKANDVSICLFDADRDRDLDIYLARGGGMLPEGDAGYQDYLLMNDGKGNFSKTGTIPSHLTSKSVVRSADIDQDGDEDLFIGTAFIPSRYPESVNGSIWRNDSQNGQIAFTDITEKQAPSLKQIGLIRDVLWMDADGDKDPDLFVTGTWMGIHYFENKKGMLEEKKNELRSLTGWWNKLTAADMDQDGDIDLVAGNFGTNGYCNGTKKEPVNVYGGDFDLNKRFDLLLSVWKPSVLHGKRNAFPVAGRDLLAEEIPSVKKQYSTYKPYAGADIQKVLSNMKGKASIEKEAICFASCWIENKGKGNWETHVLPAPAQWSPVYGILAGDFTNDGITDLIITGNEYGMHPHLGRYDASCGLLLKGTGKGQLYPLSIQESGIFIDGNAKGLAAFQVGKSGRASFAVAVNRGMLKAFEQRR